MIALGAFTGARIEELCSLTVKDVADGAFIIRDAKTDAGDRFVPVHPELLPLVATMTKAAVGGFLVPSTAKGKYGIRSDPLSKRFGTLKVQEGFDASRSFHSIRKTVATQLEQAKVPEGVAADILGHEKKTMTYGLYSGGSSLADKLEAISRVRYPSNLAHLDSQRT